MVDGQCPRSTYLVEPGDERLDAAREALHLVLQRLCTVPPPQHTRSSSTIMNSSPLPQQPARLCSSPSNVSTPLCPSPIATITDHTTAQGRYPLTLVHLERPDVGLCSGLLSLERVDGFPQLGRLPLQLLHAGLRTDLLLLPRPYQGQDGDGSVSGGHTVLAPMSLPPPGMPAALLTCRRSALDSLMRLSCCTWASRALCSACDSGAPEPPPPGCAARALRSSSSSARACDPTSHHPPTPSAADTCVSVSGDQAW